MDGAFRLKTFDEFRLRNLEQCLPDSAMSQRMRGLLEICRRYGEEPLIPGVQFKSSSEIYQHYQARMSHLRQERFAIGLLDSKHRFISDQTVGIGILNRSLVHPREVFAGAV